MIPCCCLQQILYWRQDFEWPSGSCSELDCGNHDDWGYGTGWWLMTAIESQKNFLDTVVAGPRDKQVRSTVWSRVLQNYTAGWSQTLAVSYVQIITLLCQGRDRTKWTGHMWERLEDSDYLKAPCLAGTLFAAASPSLPGEASPLLLEKSSTILPGAVLWKAGSSFSQHLFLPLVEVRAQRSPSLPTQPVCVGGAWVVFSCGVWLEGSSSCLKVFCLTTLLLSWFFGQWEQAFVGNIYGLYSLVFLTADFLGSKSDVYQAKGKPRMCHCAVFQFPRSLDSLPSLHLSKSSYVFFIYSVLNL